MVSLQHGIEGAVPQSVLFSPYGRKDLAEENPGDEAAGSVANGLSPEAGEVRPCACPKSGKASHKTTTSLHRTAPGRRSKLSDMRRNLLPPLLRGLLKNWAQFRPSEVSPYSSRLREP